MPISPSKSDAFLEALKASAAELPPLPSPSPMFALNAMFSGVLCDLTALRAFGWTLLTPLSAPDDPRKSVFYTWKGMTWLKRVWSLPHGAKVVFRLAASPPLVPAPREPHAYVHMPAGLVSRRAHAGEIPCRAFIRFLAAHPVPAAPPPIPTSPPPLRSCLRPSMAATCPPRSSRPSRPSSRNVPRRFPVASAPTYAAP